MEENINEAKAYYDEEMRKFLLFDREQRKKLKTIDKYGCITEIGLKTLINNKNLLISADRFNDALNDAHAELFGDEYCLIPVNYLGKDSKAYNMEYEACKVAVMSAIEKMCGFKLKIRHLPALYEGEVDCIIFEKEYEVERNDC